MSTIRVLLFSDEPILAAGLKAVFGKVSGYELQGSSDQLDLVLQLAALREPDVLLMDFTPAENFGSLLELRREAPELRIVLWAHRISMEAAYQAMKIGVHGILCKTAGVDVLLKCLRAVAGGELWFDRELAAGFIQAKTVALTPRETQLVTLVAEGLRNKEIGALLSISEATVRMYLSTLFRKLGVKDRYELAIYGMRNVFYGQTRESAERDGPHVQWPSGNRRVLVLDRSPDRTASPGPHQIQRLARISAQR